jgi:hypothetical protein
MTKVCSPGAGLMVCSSITTQESTDKLFSSCIGLDNSEFYVGDCGLLARSLEDFSSSNDLMTWPFDAERRGFTLSNMGLMLNAEVFTGVTWGGAQPVDRLFSIILNCAWSWHSRRRPVQLFLRKTGEGQIFQRVSNVVRPWPDTSRVRAWESTGRHDILIQDVEGDKVSNDAVQLTLVRSDSKRTPYWWAVHHRYKFDRISRSWRPLLDKRDFIWAMKEEYILGLSEESVLIINDAGLLTEIHVLIGGGHNSSVDPGDLWVSGPRKGSTCRFGILIKLISSTPVAGIWSMHQGEHLGSLDKYFNWDRPYPQTASLGDNRVIRIGLHPEGPPKKKAGLELRREIARVEGKKLSWISSSFDVSINRSFRLQIKLERDIGELYYVPSMSGTLPKPFPTPLVEWGDTEEKIRNTWTLPDFPADYPIKTERGSISPAPSLLSIPEDQIWSDFEATGKKVSRSSSPRVECRDQHPSDGEQQ